MKISTDFGVAFPGNKNPLGRSHSCPFSQPRPLQAFPPPLTFGLRTASATITGSRQLSASTQVSKEARSRPAKTAEWLHITGRENKSPNQWRTVLRVKHANKYIPPAPDSRGTSGDAHRRHSRHVRDSRGTVIRSLPKVNVLNWVSHR